MDTKIYKTKEGAERGKQKIINTWAKWLKMEDKLYIVKSFADGLYRLQDYANRRLTAEEEKNKYYELI